MAGKHKKVILINKNKIDWLLILRMQIHGYPITDILVSDMSFLSVDEELISAIERKDSEFPYKEYIDKNYPSLAQWFIPDDFKLFSVGDREWYKLYPAAYTLN